MSFNNQYIHLGTAIPPVEPIDTRKGRTFLADVQTGEKRTQAYLKLLKVEDIAREALCATLARFLGLPITQAYYVYVDPSYVDGQAGNADNIAFGLEKDRYYPTFPVRGSSLDSLIQGWPDALSCAVFDEWIFNSDRLPDNLVFDSSGVYWLIDHDETLPNYASPRAPANSSLLCMLSKSKSEIETELWRLRNKAVACVQQYEAIDWGRVLEWLRPNDLLGSESHYIRYIDFLKNRIPEMHAIITASMGIRQKQLGLPGSKVQIKKIGKET